jgi:membrane protease subunit HflK
MRYFLAAVVLAFVGYLLTGVTQVRLGERAVVRQFGRVVDKPGPGLRIGLPWGMERVDRVPVDFVRPVRIGFEPGSEETEDSTPAGQLLTRDHNLVNVQVVLDYTVSDASVEDYVVAAERVDEVLARAAEAVLAEWVAAHKVDEVLIQGKAELPGWLVGHTQALIEPYRLGVLIQSASVTYLFPPDEVKLAFDEATRAETAMTTEEHKARQEAERRLRAAQSEKEHIGKLTDAYVLEQKALAHAEADAFEKRLDQYNLLRRDNPAFLVGLWWDEIGTLFARLKETGRIDLLDNHLGADGLDITIAPPALRKK